MNTMRPDDFQEQIKTALENLYDFPALHRHPLALDLKKSDEPAGHLLRRELIAAIESLNPGANTAVRSGPGRLYNLLHMHYVGGMTLQETANDLGISLRQAYRDLRRGHESVSEIVWFNRQQQPIEQSAMPEVSSLQSEVRRLQRHITATDITQIMETALTAVAKLAEHHNIQFEVTRPDDPVILSTNPVIARQVFIHILSQTIQQVGAATISLHLRPADTGAILTLCTDAQTTKIQITHVITQLVDQLKWKMGDDCALSLVMNTSDSTVLIIDDNEGLVDLLKRYLGGQHFQVVGTSHGNEGLRLAEKLQPDVIILDLMMPEMDGWDLLQRIRTNIITRDVPVIICSVINDPELAYSLGASMFIAKPVTKDTILDALQQLNL